MRSGHNFSGGAGCGRGVALIVALLLLAGCSHPDLPPAETATATPATASGSKADAKAYETASKACKEETEKKGFASVLGIFSRLRRGSAEEQFAACMKKKGYEI
jgi:hypothetical protein